MKRLFAAICFALFFICSGQTKVYPDVDFNVTKEINGLLYFKADTTLVTGRVIRYNRKKVAKRYIMVRNGKPDGLGWAYFDEEYESPKESAFGSILFATAFVTGAALAVSGNDINMRGNINPVTTDIKPSYIIPSEISDILDYNKEIAAKADDDMSQRNEILKNITSDNEKGNEFSKNNSGDDQLETNVNDIDDKKNGIWEEFYPRGNLKRKGFYIEGEKEGLFEEYYENGQLKRKINFKKGKKDGLWEQYHPNGQLWAEGHQKVGKMIGEWTYYDQNGKIHLTETYENGKLIKEVIPTPATCYVEGETPTLINTFNYAGHKYQYMKMNVSWDMAKKLAEKKGGYLAVFETLEEMNYVTGARVRKGTYWLGLSDSRKEGDWTWIDETALEKSWEGNLNTGHGLKNRNYAHIMVQGGLMSRHISGRLPEGWKGERCVSGYLVEFDMTD